MVVGVLLAGLPNLSAGQVGPLFGGDLTPPTRRRPLLDEALPTGARSEPRETRPRNARHAWCSFRRPVCVRGGDDLTEVAANSWLSALEQAFERIVLVLGAPPPLPDWGAGGSDALDLYLTNSGPTVDVYGEPLDRVLRPAASAYCVAGAGAWIERAAALCVGEAVAWRLDPTETPHARRALATFLWWQIARPTSEDLAAVDVEQAHPELPVITMEPDWAREGSALFFEYLTAARAAGSVDLVLASFALSAPQQAAPAWLWNNEPDVFDVWRSTFGDEPSERAAWLVDWAIWRAELGRGSNSGAGLLWAEGVNRVRFEWRIPWSTLPRRVAPKRPIAPTGSTFIWVDLDAVPAGASLAFIADWEPPVAFKWVLLTLKANGELVGRLDVPYLEGGTHVERSLVRLDSAQAVLIAGVNVGDLGPSYPFDPDFAPFEPHSYTVHLAQLR